jgi:citrate lyase gamma subunit
MKIKPRKKVGIHFDIQFNAEYEDGIIKKQTKFDVLEKRKITEIKVNDDDKYPEVTSSIKEFMIRNKLDHE